VAIAVALAGIAPAVHGLVTRRLFLKTAGLGILGKGATLEATADYTLGTNGSCPFTLSGQLLANGQARDEARLAINPAPPCGAQQTQPAGSPWTLRLGAGGSLILNGAKALVIDRGGALHCVYQTTEALGTIAGLTPVHGTAHATLHPNKKLSDRACPKVERLTVVLTHLRANNEFSKTLEPVEGEVR
jgi:hypothetical protein